MRKTISIAFLLLFGWVFVPVYGGLVVSNPVFPLAEAGEQPGDSDIAGAPGNLSANASFADISAQASILTDIQPNALDATISGSGSVSNVPFIPGENNFGFSYSLLSIDFSITEGLYAYNFTGSFEANATGLLPVSQAGMVGSLEEISGGGTTPVWREGDVSFGFSDPQSFTFNNVGEGTDGLVSGTQGLSGMLGVGDYTVVLSGSMSSVGDGTYDYTAGFSLEEIPSPDPVIPEPATLGLLSIPGLVLFFLFRRSRAKRHLRFSGPGHP